MLQNIGLGSLGVSYSLINGWVYNNEVGNMTTALQNNLGEMFNSRIMNVLYLWLHGRIRYLVQNAQSRMEVFHQTVMLWCRDFYMVCLYISRCATHTFMSKCVWCSHLLWWNGIDKFSYSTIILYNSFNIKMIKNR